MKNIGFKINEQTYFYIGFGIGNKLNEVKIPKHVRWKIEDEITEHVCKLIHVQAYFKISDTLLDGNQNIT